MPTFIMTTQSLLHIEIIHSFIAKIEKSFAYNSCIYNSQELKDLWNSVPENGDIVVVSYVYYWTEF